VRARRALVAGVALLSVGAGPRRSSPAPTSWIVAGATLIDGTGRDPIPDSFVAFQDGKITDVSTMARRRGMMTLSRNVHVIDGGGKWILPGFVDARAQLPGRSPASRMIRWGVTTAGLAPGIAPPHGTTDEGSEKVPGSPELFFFGDFRRVRLVPPSPLGEGVLSDWKRAGVIAVAELARAEYLAGPREFVLRVLSDARFAKSFPSPPRPARSSDGHATDAARVATLRANVNALARAGIPVALATDLPIFPGAAAHIELERLVRAGIEPLEAIHDGTEVSARALGREDRGVLAAGNVADFLLLDEDPVADIRNTGSIAAVYRGGRLAWASKP